MGIKLLLLCLLFVVTSGHLKLQCTKQTLNSWNYAYARSVVDGARQITFMRVVEKNSVADCTYRQSFGFFGADVWVHRGCRALFKICYRPGTSSTVSCSSKDFNYKECDSGVSRITAVYPIRQFSWSPCLPGFSYGKKTNLVWVDKGCRAEFRVTA